MVVASLSLRSLLRVVKPKSKKEDNKHQDYGRSIALSSRKSKTEKRFQKTQDKMAKGGLFAEDAASGFDFESYPFQSLYAWVS